MTFALRFREHSHFQRTVLQTVLAGALSGIAYIVALKLGVTGWPAAVLAAIALGLAMGTGLTPHDATRRRVQQGFRIALLFVGAAALLTLTGTERLVGFGVAFAAAFAVDRTGWRSLLSAVVGGLGAVIALEVAFRFGMSAELSSLPSTAIAAIAGAVFSLALAAPMAVRHLDLLRDQVAKRFPIVSRKTTGEIQDLVVRGYGVWGQARDLPETDENRALIEEAVLRLFDTAEQWGTADTGNQGDSEASLRGRMERLKERIEATGDEQVKTEYQQAHDALAEQLKYLSGIDTSRERVVARLHNYLAAMERLRLAVVTVKSSSASRRAADAAPVESVATALEELGRDLGEGV